jgi:DNA-binding transcriptional LysR family regulator
MTAIAKDNALPAAAEWGPLRYVQAVVKWQSITAAAKELSVSQPALSTAVRSLEERLGTTLFLRNPRGVVPTAAGRVLARAADDVFARLRRAQDDILGIEAAVAGQFVVGCYHAVGSVFLPGLLSRLTAQAPGIQVSFWDGIGPRVLEAVVQRTVDFGVDINSDPTAGLPPDLVRVPLFRDVVGVVSAGKKPPREAALFHVPRVPSSRRVVDALRRQGKLPRRVVECGDLDLVKSLVLSRSGIGVLPWRLALAGNAGGALRLDPRLPYEVDVGSLFFRADFHRTRAALTLHDELVRQGRILDRTRLPCGVAGMSAKG